MKQRARGALVLAAVLCCPAAAPALERFPPPDFEAGYAPPALVVPPARSAVYEYIDVSVLVGALALAAYLAIRRRTRNGLFALTVFSLAYFGFWRGGCVCSVGALRDVALALAPDSCVRWLAGLPAASNPAQAGGGAVPLTTIAFFVLPLAAALTFGRVFCGSVCPLGAAQEAVLLKPLKVPQWLEHSLGLLAYAYLGLAVVFAVTGSAFIVCRYDPFVSFFRLSGSAGMFALGAGFLAVGVFVGRPYCRYLCPYGALLRLFSIVSKWHLRITPSECIVCRLCQDACPYRAILKPSEDLGARRRTEGLGRLAGLLALLPALVACGLWLGGFLGPALSRLHPTIQAAERVFLEEKGLVQGTTDASDAFYQSGRPAAELYEEATALEAGFATAGRIFGGWLALVLAVKLLSLAVRRTRSGYEPDKAKCVSCGRCFLNCPHERAGRKMTGT